MDDMKKAIYLNILQKLENPYGETSFICNELRAALKELGDVKPYEYIINDFFPEFNDLFDGYYYGIDRRWEVDKDDRWFSYENRKARITLIKFLLSNR